MKKLTILLYVALMLAPDLHAQTAAASPTPPQLPLIKRVPDKVQWVITYKLQAAGTNTGGTTEQPRKIAAAPPQKRLVIKNTGIILERTLNENGVKIDTWYIQGGLAVTAVEERNWTLTPSSQPGFDTTDYSAQDFAGFNWITQQNFSGVKAVNGRRCLVFEGRVVTIEQSEIKALASDISRDLTWAELPDDKGGSAPKPPVPRMKPQQRFFNIEDYESPVAAYIDDETRLPIALVYKTPTGTITRTYEFQAAPALPALPPDVQKMLESYKQHERRMSVPRAPV